MSRFPPTGFVATGRVRDAKRAEDAAGLLLFLENGFADSRLEGVYADVSAVTGIVAGNVLLFTEDGRELRQEVLEELWERGGHAGSSMVSTGRDSGVGRRW